MKKKALLFFTVLTNYAVQAQVVGGIPGKGMDMQTQPNGFVTQLPMAPPETKGDVYLYSDWMMADILLYHQNTKLSRYLIRVDLESNSVEINHQNQIKVLAGNRVKEFSLMRTSGVAEKFVNGGAFKLNGVNLDGFLKVIDSGKWQLLSKVQLKLIKATYVAALDAGNRNDSLVKEEVYFFSKDYTLYQVYSSSKKFAAQFNENGELVKSFIKTHKLDLKSLLSLHQIQTFLNERL